MDGATGDATGNGDIVVVDFAQFTAADTLCELLSSGTGGRDVHRVDVVSDFADRGAVPPMADLAAEYTERLWAAERRPAVVVGYCSGATLARHLTVALAERGHPVPEVQVLPARPTWATTMVEFARLRDGAGGGHTAPPWAPDARPTLDQFLAVLRGDLAAATKAHRLSRTEARRFVDLTMARYRSWLGFLIATVAAPWPDGRSDLCVTTAESADEPPIDAHDTARFPVSRDELCSLPAVRDRIVGLAR